MTVKLAKRCELCGERKNEPVKTQYDESTGEQKMLAHDSCVR